MAGENALDVDLTGQTMVITAQAAASVPRRPRACRASVPQSCRSGADTLVWLAGAPLSELTPGAHYNDRSVPRTNPQAGDDPRAARLWQESAHRVGIDLEVRT